MKQKKSIQDSDVVLYELVTREDGTLGIGNSFAAKASEVALLIQDKRAKHESASIGVVPESFSVGDGGAEVLANVSSDN